MVIKINHVEFTYRNLHLEFAISKNGRFISNKIKGTYERGVKEGNEVDEENGGNYHSKIPALRVDCRGPGRPLGPFAVTR